MQEPSKDNSGDKIYLRKRDLQKYRLVPQAVQTVISGYDSQTADTVCEPPVEYITNPKNLDDFALDEHRHLIVKHDLFNHDGMTKDGIAEAFAEFAKKEKLSFF
jgi:type I restriction enzyme M protein